MASCFFFWILVLFSHCTKKSTNEPENKKPRNQKNKKQIRNKKKNGKKKIGKNNKIAHPKGGSSGRELGLVIFSNVFSWSLVFFWILVLFSHCTKKNQQRTRKQETKKPKKQKKTRNQKTKKTNIIGKKQDCTPQGGE